MTVYVEGCSASQRVVIRHAVERVLAVLPLDGEVRVRVGGLDDRPAQIEACATDREIRIRPQILSRDPRRAQYLLYEETAHYVFGKRGMPHSVDVLTTIFQEALAGFVQWKLLCEHDPALTQLMRTERMPRGLPPEQLAGRIGRHIGFGLAGRRENDDALADWIGDDCEDPQLRALAAQLRRDVDKDRTAEELAATLSSIYTSTQTGS